MKSDQKILFAVCILTVLNLIFFLLESGTYQSLKPCGIVKECDCDKLKMVIEMDQASEDYTEHYNQYQDIDNKLILPQEIRQLQTCMLNYTDMGK